MTIPLAEQLRPKSLDDFTGQSHLVGPNKPIRKAIETGQVQSMIFWGPPGSGKTTLARIIADSIEATFYGLSAVAAGKADVRRIVEKATDDINQSRHLLFLDEIHRFNKAQQDYLLPYVEDGTLILIGATTENPSFSVINALLSRCQVFVLNQHSDQDIHQIILHAYQSLIPNTKRGQTKSEMDKDALDYLTNYANGDARKAISLLESTLKLYGQITLDTVKQALQSKHLRYDKHGEEHYDTISAFIKSMRSSNPDAAVYYLARMVEAGEDPRFIARRMVVFASEDIGMAQPTALVVANEVYRTCETIGYPECAINLAHGAIYLAKAKKDRSAYDALRRAQADVKQFGNLPIPMNLRNAPTKLMKNLGYGKGYEQYTDKDLLPDKLKAKHYY